MDVYQRLKELEIELHDPGAPIGLYKTAHRIDEALYTSGTAQL